MPKPDTVKPISPPIMPIESVVADLINTESQWDAEKLNQCFRQDDIETILKIPLPKEQSENKVMWHFDKREEYSVKSGYQLALKMKFPNEASTSDSSSKQWKVLWSLDLPEKIKIFMWRAAKNLLPFAENLWKRRILQDPICQRCKRNVETVSHALLACKAAKNIWRHAPLPMQSFNIQSGDMLSITQEIGNVLKKADMELMVAFC